MKFKYKSEAELTAMTTEQRDIYAEQKRDFEATQTKEAIEAALKEKFPAETAEQKKAREDAEKKANDEKETLTKEVGELKELINQLKEKEMIGADTGKLVSLITKEFDKIKESVKTKGNKEHEFIVKADTLRASVVGNPNALDLPEIGQLAHKKLNMYDVFPKIPVSKDQNGTVRYVDWDAATTVRAAVALAEAQQFPESTAKWATYTLELKKVGDRIPMSEEFVYDAARFAAELEMFLRTNIEIVTNAYLTNGVGTTIYPKGIVQYAPAWTPTGEGIISPTIYDLLVVMKTAITKPYGSKYNPDVVFMNASDINAYKLAKDANYNYIMPPFVGQNGGNIDGMVVIENNDIVKNTLVIGDRRYAKIYEEPGVTVATGYNGTDFEEDMLTMKARRRLNLLVRTVDQTGWLKCTSISAALSLIDNAVS